MMGFMAPRMQNNVQSLWREVLQNRNNLLQLATWFIFLILGLGVSVQTASAIETVDVDQDGASFSVQGEIVVEASDGSMILRDRQGKLWPLQPEQIKKRRTDDIPFTLMEQAELGKEILKELPSGFSIHKTKHYLICYNTSKAYAQWCGGLFERLFRAYNNYWMRRDMSLSPPEMPMVAIICKDKETWRHYAGREVGNAVDSIDGYYNLITNRIATYDLTANSRHLEGHPNPGIYLKSTVYFPSRRRASLLLP